MSDDAGFAAQHDAKDGDYKLFSFGSVSIVAQLLN